MATLDHTHTAPHSILRQTPDTAIPDVLPHGTLSALTTSPASIPDTPISNRQSDTAPALASPPLDTPAPTRISDTLQTLQTLSDSPPNICPLHQSSQA